MVRKLTDSACFRAGDDTWLREILHPVNDNVRIDYSLAHAYLEVGVSSLPHRLVTSSETYFFLEGEGCISINGEVLQVGKGDVAHVPANVDQFVQNTGPNRLVFPCIVTPPWFEQDEEILPKSSNGD
ncbi:MAG: cupin domain-containing protein [Bacteroidales bacterium]|nr:cupin domain-containing protein [Bacteroidales bacterium]